MNCLKFTQMAKFTTNGKVMNIIHHTNFQPFSTIQTHFSEHLGIQSLKKKMFFQVDDLHKQWRSPEFIFFRNIAWPPKPLNPFIPQEVCHYDLSATRKKSSSPHVYITCLVLAALYYKFIYVLLYLKCKEKRNCVFCLLVPGIYK